MTAAARSVLCCVAAVLAAGCDRLPEQPAGERPWFTFHRGHKPPGSERAGENLRVPVEPGRYPPRALGLSAQRRPPSDSWLLDADSDRDRFRRLEAVLGAEQSMREIGERFVEVHRAIAAGALALARYEWERAGKAAEIALLKRPANQEAIERELLTGPWAELGAALEAGDVEAARRAFEAARQGCLQCHVARDMAYLNHLPSLSATARWPQPGGGS